MPCLKSIENGEKWYIHEDNFELVETKEQTFKPGDQVRDKITGEVDTVELIPGMPEYDRRSYISAAYGFVLKERGWGHQKDWGKVKEYKPERQHPHCRMAIDHLLIRYESSYGIPVMSSFFDHFYGKSKRKRRGGGYMSQLSKLAKKLLDPDTKALVKAGVLDSELDVTEEGVDFVIAFFVDQNKVELAKEARKQLREQKKEDEE